MNKRLVRFALIGPGRVGSSMGLALERNGWRCSAIVHHDASTKSKTVLKRLWPGAQVGRSFNTMTNDFDLLLIAVPDDRIEQTSRSLGTTPGLSWQGKVVLHVSGVTEVDSLRALKMAGASTGALHPMASLAVRFSPASAEGILYDFYGDRRAAAMASRIVRSLSSKLLKLGSERQRLMLHTASVVASNFTVIGIRAAESLASKSVSPAAAKRMIAGLLRSTLDNLSRSEGMSALTGPLVRNDLQAIRKHLSVLESDGALLQFYRSASLLGVKLLSEGGGGALSKRELTKIRTLLED